MQRIIEVAKQEKAELIHAHTPYRVGLPALKAARKLRLPFVYEMRECGKRQQLLMVDGELMDQHIVDS